MLGIDHDLGALAALVSGPVTRPDDGDDFAAECVGFDLNSVQHPAVAIGAIDAADMIAGVRFARTHDMPVAVQATGHGATATADGGLLIATRRFDGVRIDPAARTAYVSAGARWQKVIDAAAAHGLAPLCGSSPDVGAVSYTTGGGLGPLGRRYGFAADHVRRIDLVTADGESRTVTADRDADLFWAVRGGGGNFGVVTAIEIDLMPVTELYGGGLFFPGVATESVLGEFLACRAAAPEDVTLSVAVLTFPDVPALPPPLRGTYCCHVRVAATAPAEQVEALIAPLRRAAPALVDTVRTMPFTEVASIHGDPSGPMPTHVRSLVLRDADRDTMAGIFRYVD
ncbi:MAG TPA: FAD-binding oxidoreductase, partial [Micromonosporaceae bacterium]